MSNNDNSASSTPTVSTGAAPGSSFNTSAVTATVAGNESNGSVFQNEDSTIVQQELSDSLNVIKTNKDLAVNAASGAVTAKQQAEAAQTASENAQTAAESAQTAAELALDNLDDKYLGAKTTDPALDNDGENLVDGALYFNTTDDVLKVYNLASTSWLATKPTDSELTNINALGPIASDITTVAGISSDVTSVSGISSDVSSVATITPGVTAVANIAAEVSTVSGIATEIQNVSAVDSEVQTVGQNITNVNTVAGISADVTTVSNNSANVTAVANNATNINTVSGISSDVTAVANNNTNITTVATNNADITTVAGIASDITDVALIDSNVTTVAGIDSEVSALSTIASDIVNLGNITSDITAVSNVSSEVSNVSGFSADITAVSNNENNINTVAGNTTNINTVAGVSTDVSTLAPQASGINTLSGISTDIATVSSVSSDVTTVSGISSDVSTVSGVSSDVSTVAGISSLVTTVASDSADIASLASISSDITTAASNATDISTVASNITDVNSFADTYSIGATNPATADEGDLFYNTTDNGFKYYNGSQWTTITVDTNVVEDITPQLGGNLDLNNQDITGTGNLNITGNISLSGTVDGRDIANDGLTLDTALQNVSEDTTPELGGNLDVNSNRLDNTGYVKFSLQSEHPTYEEGLIWYDSTHNTLNYYGDQSGLVHEIGIEEHQKVYNNSGVTINKGQPMYFSGNFNGYPTVGLANATDVNKYNAQGISAHDIPNNSYGYVCTAGLVENIDTSGLTAGTNFFVSLTDGAIQNESPTYPNYPMCLGWVVSSDATNGILLVNQQNHSVNSFRVRTDTHIGGDLIIDGDLTVVGSQTVASSTNIETGAPFLYLNSGDSIGEANTTFTGSGLDDAYFAGHFSGTTSTTYYVKIDATGTPDTFSWSKDNFNTTEATGVAITGGEQTLDNGIEIDFGATTGHTLNDVWSGTATPVDSDTGIWSNRNTGGTGVGYTHVGMFFDVTDSKFKLVDEYDPEPEGVINTGHSSYSAGSLVVDSVEASSASITGNITVGGTVDGRDIAHDGSKLDGIAAGATADQTITLSGDATGTGTTSINVSLSANSVGSNEISANAVNASELNVSGNGTTSQFLRSDGDGTFTWATPTDTNTTYSAGSGLSLTGTTFANTAPDQTVSLTGSGATTVTGTYPNFTISSTDTDTNTTYSQATSSTLGLVKIGYSENGKNYPVELSSGQMFVNVPWVDTNTTYSVGDGGLTQVNFTTTRRDKLNGIESGATADQTASEILTAIKTVDGSGSGLDADTVDSLHASSFIRNDTSNSVTNYGNKVTFFSNTNAATTSGSQASLECYTSGAGNDAFMAFHVGGDYATYFGLDGDTNDLFVGGWSKGASRYKIWHAGNDGSGSGLDADLLDGQHGSYYLNYNNLSNKPSIPSAANNATITLSAGTGLSGGGDFTTNQSSAETITFNLEAPYTYIDQATGNYGTIKVDDDRGVTWAGYAIRDDWVFMSNGAGSVGIYNDTDNEWAIYAEQNSYVELRANGTHELSAQNGYGFAPNSMRSPIFYDSNDTAYYADPASNSRTNTEQTNYLGLGTASNTSGSYRLNMGGSIDMNANSIDYVSQLHFNDNLRFYDNGDDSYLTFKYGDINSGGIQMLDGDGTLQSWWYGAGNGEGGLLDNDGAWAVRVRTSTNPLTLYCDNNAEFYVYNTYTYSPGSSRAPLFYDANNTAYYTNPASTSVLNDIYLEGEIYHNGDTNTYIQFHALDQWRVVTGGVERLEVNNSAITASVSITSSGNITAYSDIRLKENVQTIDDALEKVLSMRGVTFTKDGKDGLGVIAQEVEKVIPQVVLTADDEMQTKSVDYGNIVGLLIEAIKEQQEEIEALKNKINLIEE